MTLHPVVTHCGHTFDRDALETRRVLGAHICPVCRSDLPDTESECYGLSVNPELRGEAEAWHLDQSAHEIEAACALAEDGTSIPADELTLSDEIIGKGPFGQVRLGEWAGRAVAVKQVPLEAAGAPRAITSELVALRSLQHPHVVSLFGATCKEKMITDDEAEVTEIWLVLELAPHGSLNDFISGASPESLESIFGDSAALPGATATFYRIGAEIACALACLHRRHRVHGFIKPENVLVFADGHVKLADFHLSALSYTRRSGKGAPAYTAPEVSVDGGRLSPASDVFSLSVVLAEILTGEKAFEALGDDEDAITAALATGERPAMPQSVPADVRQLVGRCWSATAADRPRAGALQLTLISLSGQSMVMSLHSHSATSLPAVAEA
eukprot:CAMPEP_0179869450 /NCGR_PEP_ID=MMETSP0982-20121206/19544_1 /TAXON_ID=483367 /ORGANISM="non described non described, Strain CCMP 2436" /LENGTH=383 /DNA_ID=CAMNT_0021759545 /DNA_START=114 /DNA_END=1265 /DNA_ORIENTATION=-